MIGTNIYGCSATAAITQSVSECIGIGSHSPDLSAKILIFPNPNNGCFKIQSEKEIQLLIINSRGLTVRKVYLNSAINLETEINYLKNGIYYLININQPEKLGKKILVY